MAYRQESYLYEQQHGSLSCSHSPLFKWSCPSWCFASASPSLWWCCSLWGHSSWELVTVFKFTLIEKNQSNEYASNAFFFFFKWGSPSVLSQKGPLGLLMPQLEEFSALSLPMCLPSSWLPWAKPYPALRWMLLQENTRSSAVGHRSWLAPGMVKGSGLRERAFFNYKKKEQSILDMGEKNIWKAFHLTRLFCDI